MAICSNCNNKIGLMQKTFKKEDISHQHISEKIEKEALELAKQPKEELKEEKEHSENNDSKEEQKIPLFLCHECFNNEIEEKKRQRAEELRSDIEKLDQEIEKLPRWEYDKISDFEKLKEMGLKGWELVSVIREKVEEQEKKVFFLKRPLSKERCSLLHLFE